MSETTLKLPYKRFVAQVSTGSPRPKSSYLSLMAENLNALFPCPWREASDVPVSLTGHDFTAATQFSDSYDAFKLTGNYDPNTMTEIAYAGMVAYRFKVPSSAVSGGANITSVKIPVSRDRYERSGVRIHIYPGSNQAVLPAHYTLDDLRQLGTFGKAAILAQPSTPYLTASVPASETVEFTGFSQPAGTYVWVVMSIEDYEDTWELYNEKERRLYAIEGSAMINGWDVEVTFDSEVTPDPDDEFVICCGFALPEIGVGPAGIQVETQFTGDQLKTFDDVDGADGVKMLNESADYKTDIPLEQSVAGLRMAYAALYSGLADPVPPASHAMRPGAKFHLEATSIKKITDDGDVSVGVWRITASALAVPFAAPSSFAATSVLFQWERFTNPVTPGLVWRVWLKQGSAARAMPELADAAFWLPGSTAADGYDLIGTFAASRNSGSAEIPIALTSPLGTILVTAFIPMDGINPSAGMDTSFGCADEFTPTITLK